MNEKYVINLVLHKQSNYATKSLDQIKDCVYKVVKKNFFFFWPVTKVEVRYGGSTILSLGVDDCEPLVERNVILYI